LYMHEEEITQNDLYPATALVLAEMNAEIAKFVRGRLA
jgi:hypothetical protein